MLAAWTNHEREGSSINSFLRVHLASLKRRMRRWRGQVDGKKVVLVHVLMHFFLVDVSGDFTFLHDECECDSFVVDV